eukprot:gene42529-51962_t
MFRAVASVAKRSAPLFKGVPKTPMGQFRAFSEKLDIPTDAELQAGRRKEELEAEVSGQVGFNRDPIIPDINAGTKENPILVPSGEHERVVGFEDPLTHQMTWFTLKEGSLFFVPDINLYFKLAPLGGHH